MAKLSARISGPTTDPFTQAVKARLGITDATASADDILAAFDQARAAAVPPAPPAASASLYERAWGRPAATPVAAATLDLVRRAGWGA